MTVARLPIALVRRASPLRPLALLLLSTDPARVLELCARIGGESIPDLFVVPGGWLIDVEPPAGFFEPETVRLRRLAENFLVPADADLVPSLFPDEARALSREVGWILLPGRTLSFDPGEPLPAWRLLKPGPISSPPWKPLPEVRLPVSQLLSISRPTPPDIVDELLGGAGSGVGEETPDAPADAGGVRGAIARGLMGLGRGLNSLGEKMGMGPLARLGAGLAGKAASLVPRLAESVLGKQEAALRELLRKFEDGNIDDALKQAIPIGGDAGRGGRVSGSSDLGRRDTRYRLSDILGGGSGPASWWLGGWDVQSKLVEEYRKAATEALNRGDFLRAAYIYGKLLSDFNSAADALSRGGRHRDAAVVYRDKLSRPDAAVREFVLAGEIDEALALCKTHELHDTAGDILLSLGETEWAKVEFIAAANGMIQKNYDWLKAAEYLLSKTHDEDLAAEYLRCGWDSRIASHPSNAVPCAIRLSSLFASRLPQEPLLTLVREAGEYLSEPGRVQEAASFYRNLSSIAARTGPLAGELRDTARQGLALKLRQFQGSAAGATSLASELFGQGSLFGPDVVGDADFATRAAVKALPVKPTRWPASPYTSVRLGVGAVTASASAAASGELFVGFQHGMIVCYRPDGAVVMTVANQTGVAVGGLATDLTGEHLAILKPQTGSSTTFQQIDVPRTSAVLSASASDLGRVLYDLILLQRKPDGGFGVVHSQPTWVEDVTRLVPDIGTRGRELLIHLTSEVVTVGYDLKLTEVAPLGFDASEPRGRELLSEFTIHGGRGRRVVQIDEDAVSFPEEDSYWNHVWKLLRREGAYNVPPFSWSMVSAEMLQMAGILRDGSLEFVLVDLSGKDIRLVSMLRSDVPEGYISVAVWDRDKVVAVTQDRIRFLRATPNGFTEWATSTAFATPAKVLSVSVSSATREVLVLLLDGELIRAPVPIG